MKQITTIIRLILSVGVFVGVLYYSVELKNTSIGWRLFYSFMSLIILSLFGVDASNGCGEQENEEQNK